MKYYIVADVHGFYDELIKALKEKGWENDNPEHVFVSLGDLLDRGKQPLQCLEFVCNLPRERKILIRGNHEDLMLEMIDRGLPSMHDFHNGTIHTAIDCWGGTIREEEDYNHAIQYFKELEEWNAYINSCINYCEINNNIFVHGWIPRNPNWRSASDEEWKSARWVNGMKEWALGNVAPGETIWCGHWHTSFGHCNIHGKCEDEFSEDAFFTPFKDNGIVAMDACTVYSGFINCEVLEI